MYRLLPLLGDAGLGILVIVVTSVIYNYQNPLVWLLLPLIFLPDLDGLAEILKKGQVAASADNPHDHRELLHKPVIWLIVGVLFWSLNEYVGTVLFFLFLLHFLHDSVLIGWGVPWLWPLTNKRYKFFTNEQNENSLSRVDWIRSWDKEELHDSIIKYGHEDWIERYYLSLNTISIIEYGIFLLSIVALTLYFFV